MAPSDQEPQIEQPKHQAERTYVVHVDLRFRKSPQDASKDGTQGAANYRLEEAVGLAQAIDLDVVASYICPISRPRPATLIGKGWVTRLA